ncbi:glycogen synthase GlgA [Prosthecomicrobium pneumaticum]|uniref:Glycogen synthase n=1 Tax=Prosthecomicrobium pneumaticum TaxID=81895 RepID=A0A7W9FL36_9HYPH|nr:glycogen synthase GlgA [Prosthecomicrobium pneumaticum]MBB5752278.1 starch synthase [Prosthecomicrobium pneumaticum]
MAATGAATAPQSPADPISEPAGGDIAAATEPPAAPAEPRPALRALSVTSEVYPLVKTGGLADVAGALPKALADHGVETVTLVPGYPRVMAALEAAEPVHFFADLFGGPARLLRASAAGLDLLIVDAPHLYDRPGGPYLDPNGQDFADNPIRFAALGAAAAAVGLGYAGSWQPDLVHGHDWQSGPAIAYLAYAEGPRPATVATVHNLAFQGQFALSLVGVLGLPPRALSVEGVEYFGSVGYLKAALRLADRVTTVSPSYAREIRTPEGGMGLDGVLRARGAAFSGILNGIDTGIWNPQADPLVPHPFGPDSLAERQGNKAALQRSLGLDEHRDALLFGVVSRLTWQKGLDLLVDRLDALMMTGAQLVVLGDGDAAIAEGLRGIAAQHPNRVALATGYDEGLAHLIQAGADALLVPSRFEPCGLTQLCALRYGALPVVSRVGGLNDTVIDANPVALAAGVATGFQFGPVSALGLEAVLHRVVELWRDRPAWRRMQENAMRTDVSWDRAAAAYAALYRQAVAERAVGE